MNMSPLRRLGLIGAVMSLAACAEDEPQPVFSIATATLRDIVLSARADGVIEPIQTVEIKSKAAGEIIEVAVDVGDAVTRDQIMVRVDPRTPRNALIQAEADSAAADARLINAQRQLTRSATLFQSESITEEQYETANLERANAYAALVRAQRILEDARISFEDTEVRAASRGVILTRAVEVGTVIASASRDVGGGAVLMTMANLDTVQVRTLVHELDIGKIRPGMAVSTTVNAYASQLFPAVVLKIEPESVDDQGKTMFPVLIRIPNQGGLLKPGMNTKVEIHIGERQQVTSVANAALRGRRDLATAATALGLTVEDITAQLDEAARIARGDTAPPSDAKPASENSFEFGGQTIQLPVGMTRTQVAAVVGRMRSGGFQNMSSEDRAVMSVLQRATGGGPGGGGGRPAGGNGGGRQGRSGQGGASATYIVFTLANGEIRPIEIRTGLTDLEYSEVVSGLTPGDTVLLLPSSSLLQSQQELQDRMRRFSGGGLPGIGGTGGGGGRR